MPGPYVIEVIAVEEGQQDVDVQQGPAWVSAVDESGDGSLVGGVSAARTDGDHLDRGGRRLVRQEPVDDPEPRRPLIGKVKPQPPAPR